MKPSASIPPIPPETDDCLLPPSHDLIRRLDEALLGMDAVIEASRDAMLLADEEGLILQANRAACEQTGRGRGELLGAPLAGLGAEFARLDTAALAARFAAPRVTGLKRGQGGFPAELSVSPLSLGDRRLLLIILRDVSQRLRQERALREIAEENTALLECIPDAVLVLDRGGLCLEAHGLGLAEFLDSVRELPLRRFQAALEAGQASEFERRLDEFNLDSRAAKFEFRLGDPPREFEARLAPLPGGRTLLLAREETERNAAQRELARMERLAAAGRMAAGMAHEIRNPLSVIHAGAQLLELDGADPGQAAAAAQRIYLQCERIEAVVRDALGYARRSDPSETACEVADLIKRSLHLAQLQYGPDHLKVLVLREVQDPSPRVRMRPSELEQVLVNLIMNAYQAMAGRGRLALRSRPEPGRLRLEVEDDGPGATDERLARLFEPFFTTKNHGSGLGLSICRRLVEGCGGAMRAERVQPHGLRFVLEFPLAGDAGARP